jgi:hypothetical protein
MILDFGFWILDSLAWALKLTVLAVALLLLAGPAYAQDKAAEPEPPRTFGAEEDPVRAAIRAELETEYRAAMERRLAQQMENYEGSLRSLWISNVAVWSVLLLFIVMQALSARKRQQELSRLRAERGDHR